jgi:hypothetical protein
MEKIIISTSEQVGLQEIIDLYIHLDWNPLFGIKRKTLKEILHQATSIITARTHTGKLVGIARIIADHCGYETRVDIVIHPSYTQQHIASQFLHLIKTKFGSPIILNQ